MVEIRTRFQWPLSPVQASDWVRCVKLCGDQGQAKQIVQEMVDEGKMTADRGVAVFRAKWRAIAPLPAPPTPVDYTQFRGAAAKLREQVVQSGDAKLKAVLDNVDHVRASKPLAWQPLSEDEQQRRRARIVAQLQAAQAVTPLCGKPSILCALPPSGDDLGEEEQERPKMADRRL